MLDYKIKELKKQIEPKEEQITDMKDQVKVRATPCYAAVLCCDVLYSPSTGRYVLVALCCGAGWGYNAFLLHFMLCCAVLC